MILYLPWDIIFVVLLEKLHGLRHAELYELYYIYLLDNYQLPIVINQIRARIVSLWNFNVIQMFTENEVFIKVCFVPKVGVQVLYYFRVATIYIYSIYVYTHTAVLRDSFVRLTENKNLQRSRWTLYHRIEHLHIVVFDWR
jgi:hypothetical protein